MSSFPFSGILMGIFLLTSMTILLSRNWRVIILAMAVQSIGVFGLVSIIWPIGLASIKLIVGWMTASILGAARILDVREDLAETELSGRLFKFITAGMVFVIALFLSPALVTWLGIPASLAQGFILLTGMGFVQISMNQDPIRVVVGLLTFLAGFEVLYAYVENSILVTGMLAIVNLGVALVGSILLTNFTQEELS